MILYNEFEPLFETFSKLVEENGNENVTTNKILGSLEILAIKKELRNQIKIFICDLAGNKREI